MRYDEWILGKAYMVAQDNDHALLRVRQGPSNDTTRETFLHSLFPRLGHCVIACVYQRYRHILRNSG